MQYIRVTMYFPLGCNCHRLDEAKTELVTIQDLQKNTTGLVMFIKWFILPTRGKEFRHHFPLEVVVKFQANRVKIAGTPHLSVGGAALLKFHTG